jgi:hypothetical protein
MGQRKSFSDRAAYLLLGFICILSCCNRTALAEAAVSTPKVWLEDSLHRVFPGTLPVARSEMELLSARNATVAFQAIVRNEEPTRLRVVCSATGTDNLSIVIRRVGYVPMPHRDTDIPMNLAENGGPLPGMVPDPLFPEHVVSAGPAESDAFWITVKVPASTMSGVHDITVHLSTEGDAKHPSQLLGDLTVHLNVKPLTLRPRHDFPFTQWWSADAIYDAYHTTPFSETWWKYAQLYVQDMVDHGANMINVPLLQDRREIVKRPSQLLKVVEVSPGKYSFDFNDVHRFIAMARSAGMQYFEFSHLWLYFNAADPVHVYEQKNGEYVLLWPTKTSGTTGVYRNFLAQMFPAMHEFLKQEHLADDQVIFHVSDEPFEGDAIENYRKDRALLREIAPWVRTMDALSDVRFGKEHITDIPVPIMNAAQNYIDAGLDYWTYNCTGPRGAYPNRFFDTPLPTLRMTGWLLYRLQAKGFLHWGYNYWYKMDTQQLEDTFTEAAGGAWPGIAYGDPFVVYPGPDGPIDSLRWEVFAQSLQDYTLLQTAGVKPDSALLSEMHSYTQYPRDAAWIQEKVKEVLNGAR